MLDCWKAEPMNRPSFTELVERLHDKLLQDYTEVVSIVSESNFFSDVFENNQN